MNFATRVEGHYVTRNSNGFYGTDKKGTIITEYYAERADAEDALLDTLFPPHMENDAFYRQPDWMEDPTLDFE